MIIIQHRPEDKPPVQYYEYTCHCGCKFVTSSEEFSKERRLNGASFLMCPDCSHIVHEQDMTKISPEQFLAYKEKYE